MEMTGRERFLTALNHGQPDRVPLFDFLFQKDLFEAVNGRRTEVYNAEDAVELSLRVGLDSVWIPDSGFAGYAIEMKPDNTYVDEWGTTFMSNTAISWPIDAPIDYPIKDWEDFKNYTWPDPNDLHRVEGVKDALKLAEGKIAVMGGVSGPFTRLLFLMGLEETCIAAYEEPELFHAMMRRSIEYDIQAGLHLLEAGADAIIISEDMGYNEGTFLSPDMMRTFMLPYVREMVIAFRKAGAPIMLHCDGNMNAIMDDLVALGVDAWQPLERKGHNDLAAVKARYGKVLTPIGNVDSSTTLPYGTKEDVIAQTKECLRVAAPGGGYVLGSDHSLHDGIPVENIFAMWETAKRYGNYATQDFSQL